MRTGNCLLYISAVLAVCLVQAGFGVRLARAQDAAILTGHVSSLEEGPMEGVVVSAKKDGATITVSVVTDNDGRYSFPAARLEPGRYQLSIRAGGYELDSPKGVDLSAAQPATAEIKLRATKNIASRSPMGNGSPICRARTGKKEYCLAATVATACNASCARSTTPPNFCKSSSAWPAITPAAPRFIRNGWSVTSNAT